MLTKASADIVHKAVRHEVVLSACGVTFSSKIDNRHRQCSVFVVLLSGTSSYINITTSGNLHANRFCNILLCVTVTHKMHSVWFGLLPNKLGVMNHIALLWAHRSYRYNYWNVVNVNVCWYKKKNEYISVWTIFG